MTRFLFGLLACLAAVSAHAGILYRWEATCTERYFLTDDDKLVLSCKQPIRGTLLMPDGYVPGTGYRFPDDGLPPPQFKILDTHFGTIWLPIGDSEGLDAELPAESGPGNLNAAWPSGHIFLPGESAFELTVPSSYVIVTSDAYFTLIPEPGTLLLASLALGIAVMRSRQARPQRQ